MNQYWKQGNEWDGISISLTEWDHNTGVNHIIIPEYHKGCRDDCGQEDMPVEGYQ